MARHDGLGPVRFGRREGTDPLCPFCGTELKRPVDMELSTGEIVPGGWCSGCGAIFLVDPTGKNVGEVMMQALGIVSEKMQKDMADLAAGEDYDDAILNYDARLHRSPGASRSAMDRYGRMYLVKMKQKT